MCPKVGQNLWLTEIQKMFEHLQEKVSNEAQSSGSRSLLSILRLLTEMSQAELDAVIALYEEHHAKSNKVQQGPTRGGAGGG